jgi:hypothetical protein
VFEALKAAKVDGGMVLDIGLPTEVTRLNRSATRV